MKYVAALIVPPLALLMIGKPGHFVVNACLWILSIPLTLMFGIFVLLWLGCIVHAFGMCLEHDAEHHDQHVRDNGDIEIVPKH
ncbi:MAG TPA: hypothetical protein VGI81_27750 [Tepidisphaeraceae bacterium]|jgi:hypothetical protein